jgi:hypothetical protein
MSDIFGIERLEQLLSIGCCIAIATEWKIAGQNSAGWYRLIGYHIDLDFEEKITDRQSKEWHQ